MKKLDNKGFTLVEVIAVVVILSVLSLLIVPSISGLLNRSKENSYSDLINSIKLSCEQYINDNRYSNTVNINCTSCESEECKQNKITIKSLLDNGYLSPSGTDDSGDYIVNPKDKKSKLDLTDDKNSICVTFDKNNKKFIYDLNPEDLKWKES